MPDVFSLLNSEWSVLYLVAVSVTGGGILAWASIYLTRWLTSIREGEIADALKHNTSRVPFVFFPVLLMTLGAHAYKIYHPGNEWIYNVSKVALVISSAALAVKILDLFEQIVLFRLGASRGGTISERKIYTRVKFVKRIIVVAILVVAIAMLLISFEKGRELGVGLLTSAGIVSVIIGFAAQKSLGNLLASLQIAFSQPIKIGDTVVIETEVGQIEEINLTYVVVRLWDKRRLIVPITFFVENSYQNWTRNDSELIASIYLYLDYKTPVEPIRKKINELVSAHPLWDGNICNVYVTDTKPQFMELRTTVSVASSSDSFELRAYLREHIIDWIAAEYPKALQNFRRE